MYRMHSLWHLDFVAQFIFLFVKTFLYRSSTSAIVLMLIHIIYL